LHACCCSCSRQLMAHRSRFLSAPSRPHPMRYNPGGLDRAGGRHGGVLFSAASLSSFPARSRFLRRSPWPTLPIRCVRALQARSTNSSSAAPETYIPDLISRAWLIVSSARPWGSTAVSASEGVIEYALLTALQEFGCCPTRKRPRRPVGPLSGADLLYRSRLRDRKHRPNK